MDSKLLPIIAEWSKKAVDDLDLVNEYNKIKDNEEALNDAFYKELSFGTAGLRGILGFGTNRMNIYIIRKATQGLSEYLKKTIKDREIHVAIGYDSRIKSDVFALETAKVLGNNGIHAHLYKVLMPVPLVSFATRELHCDAGVMVTASHNPSKYNGYKVYGPDGCQITSSFASGVTEEMNKVNPFDVKAGNVEELTKNGLFEYISDEIFTSFIERVKKESVLGSEVIDKNVSIIYSPLNGAGLVPVTTILKECGYTNVKIVEEQRLPDGNFPTCPYPNPEIREAMELGIKYAIENKADLLVATDPDCDRVGIAVKDGEKYTLLTGNQVGVLLLNYIAEMRSKNGTMPKEAHAVKTIVSTDMVDEIAKHYGIKLHSVLTGFKYIGDVIKGLEDKGLESSYILGFEESYGYLSGTHARDKDAVNGAFLIVEMFSYYKTHGISLIEKLNELYKKFGYFLNKTDSFTFEGAAGFNKMKEIMLSLRDAMPSIGNYKVINTIDYQKGIDGLPSADVIKFSLDNGCGIIVRPSGTEPKIKVYYSVKSDNEENALKIYEELKAVMVNKLK